VPHNRQLLWHGTNVSAGAAIMSGGLRIMPHSGGRGNNHDHNNCIDGTTQAPEHQFDVPNFTRTLILTLILALVLTLILALVLTLILTLILILILTLILTARWQGHLLCERE
jgi:hypothetical protein